MAGPIIGGLLGAFIPIRWVFVINGVMLLVAALLVKVAKLEAKVGEARSHGEAADAGAGSNL
ncbi:Major Facilitator Superfamily protein [compost metagenome]